MSNALDLTFKPFWRLDQVGRCIAQLFWQIVHAATIAHIFNGVCSDQVRRLETFRNFQIRLFDLV